jgi:5'-nucleotidase
MPKSGERPGTVGAAMTAMLLGLPAMALSQAFSDRESVHWQTERALAPQVITRFAGGRLVPQRHPQHQFPRQARGGGRAG